MSTNNGKDKGNYSGALCCSFCGKSQKSGEAGSGQIAFPGVLVVGIEPAGRRFPRRSDPPTVRHGDRLCLGEIGRLRRPSRVLKCT